ncbi:alpha,alpha-trehalose-phosphate synthase [UDP-forming] 1 isoform X2 [Triticum aestivum]|uniref:alpha,alpha-trehalose-phosphate synthase [UDP-forming] 1 isoform X2 n=1 Tax=Triticum aestivum TaxID=4565 RepID=UPI001D011C19|nr:alpha,alpha-trehalose-phosphate synthase [UDP-forming] 1-like isoform X2 [Triticum aestivum]
MLHAPPPLEAAGSPVAHSRCLLRDLGGHGAVPADPSALYDADAATTRFLLERILRESGTARRLLTSSSSPRSSSTDAVDTDSKEPEDPADSAPGLVPVSGRADPTSVASSSGTPPATALNQPLESTEQVPASRLSALLGPNGRVLIVANRLPVTAKRHPVKKWEYPSSSGGLVSALQGIKDVQMMWVGWPGVSVPNETDQTVITEELFKRRCVPVFLDEELMDQYYSGYCNKILWPLFHYLGLPQEYKINKAKGIKSQFEAYTQANQMFAETVCKIYKEGDIIWCHDYHLMCLPKLLKQYNINMKVGWFLHTPFPSSEMYRALPNRAELLEAVLKADLVGFHAYDYARHFVSACISLLGLEGDLDSIQFDGRIVKFPIGIDAQRFTKALEGPKVKEKITEFKKLFAGRKVILGVDRLDMIKGFLQKLLAFEKFLEKNEELDSGYKVVLLQIAVPTRSDVPEYRKLASQVHELVARVNGRFGTLKATPILHLDQTVDFDSLCALYAITDVALITSLRDGMNLVSYEYVACQESNKGVLILSEFAGAAQSLGAGSIIVNPWDIAEVADAIKCALDMPTEDREKHHRHNYELVSRHTAQDWAENYVCDLYNATSKAPLRAIHTTVLPIGEAAAQYGQSNNRLLILGFNATLTGQIELFEEGADIEPKLNPEFKQPLKTLCDNENTTVVVVSGYGKSILDKNFADYKLWLAAENGMFFRRPGEEWITTRYEQDEISWAGSVKKVFEYFTKRTPRSNFEQRESSLVWNYKYADVQFGRNQATDLLQHLGAYSLSNQSAVVVQGSRSIEVRPMGVTKEGTYWSLAMLYKLIHSFVQGKAVGEIIRELDLRNIMATPIDYVLCIGHFLAKDEDIYTLPSFDVQPGAKRKGKGCQAEDCSSIKFDLNHKNYFSCTVGREHSVARYNLKGTSEVVSLLQDLAAAAAPGNMSHPP